MDRPYLKFYFKDYSGDSKLKKCSMGAQGLWVRIMCEAGDSNQYGRICRDEYDSLAPITKNEDKKVIQQQWIECEDFARALVCGIPKYKKYLQELFEREVARIDESGNIYSSRMVKDDANTKKKKANGKKGGETTQALTLFTQTVSEEINPAHPNAPERVLPNYALPNPSLRPMHFILPDEYHVEFLQDRQWTESLLMSHHVNEDELIKKIKLFSLANMKMPHLLTNGKRDKGDAQKHFCNWLIKQRTNTDLKMTTNTSVDDKF